MESKKDAAKIYKKEFLVAHPGVAAPGKHSGAKKLPKVLDAKALSAYLPKCKGCYAAAPSDGRLRVFYLLDGVQKTCSSTFALYGEEEAALRCLRLLVNVQGRRIVDCPFVV